MCSDHRHIDLATGDPADTANKQVVAYTPDGAVLIGWVGIGVLRVGMSMDQWVTATIPVRPEEFAVPGAMYGGYVVRRLVTEANRTLARDFRRARSASGRWVGHHWFVVAMTERRRGTHKLLLFLVTNAPSDLMADENRPPDGSFRIIGILPAPQDSIADVGFAMLPKPYISESSIQTLLDLARRSAKNPKSVATAMADTVFDAASSLSRGSVSHSCTNRLA